MADGYHGQFKLVHGDAIEIDGKREPEYTAWSKMLQRCYNTNDPKFKDYGDRGIVVCESWIKDYRQFLADMGRRPSPRYTLGRKDNNGNYYKENCEWQLPATQSRNRRNNKLTIASAREIRMQYNRGYSQNELAREFGVSQATIWSVIHEKIWAEDGLGRVERARIERNK
jgi:hypothetical protein